MTYSQQLAAFFHGLQFENLPEATREKTSLCLIDYLAAAWNAQGQPLTEIYVDLARNLAGKAEYVEGGTVIGTGAILPPAWAAFANAAQGHVTEVDDGHRTSTMHIGTVVIPVVLALAEDRNLDGKTMVEAIVCGYDAAIRVGSCLGPEHYTIFHTTATAGTFGAAAAAAKAMGLSEEATAWALGHAGTQAAGVWQFLPDGAVRAKAFHPAKAAQNGLMAAALAEAGVEGASHIFEGERAFLAFASPKADTGWLTRDLGTKFMIDQANFKCYPTCGQTHSMLDATRLIMDEHGVTGDQVEEVEALVYGKAVQIAGIPEPDTIETAKFSNQFCMAFLLTHGELTFENFTADVVSDPEVRALMMRVKLVQDAEMDAGFPAARPCRVTIRLKDGRSFSADNKFRRGDPENPLDVQGMCAKFTQLTSQVLPESQRKMILDWSLGVADQKECPDFLFVS